MFQMRAQFILCKYILPSFNEVKVLQQQNMLNVHHMHAHLNMYGVQINGYNLRIC